MDEFSRYSSGALWELRFTQNLAADVPAGTDPDALGEGEWLWTHFPLGDVRARASIAALSDVPAAFRDLVAEGEERIQLHGAEAWVFGVLPDFERDLGGAPLGPGRLFFACGDRRLLTARLHPLRAIDDVRRAAERGAAFATPAAVLGAQVEAFTGVVELRLDRLTDQLDVMEDQVLSERTDPGAQQLGPVRRELAQHRRELQALRGALARARTGRDVLRVHALHDHLAAAMPEIEDVDHEFAGLQERARLLHEEVDTLLNRATDRSMRTLTVISSLLIPPTLVVGAFGMNLPGMPFEHSPAGFTAATVICVALVAGAWIVLRRMNMLS